MGRPKWRGRLQYQVRFPAVHQWFTVFQIPGSRYDSIFRNLAPLESITCIYRVWHEPFSQLIFSRHILYNLSLLYVPSTYKCKLSTESILWNIPADANHLIYFVWLSNGTSSACGSHVRKKNCLQKQLGWLTARIQRSIGNARFTTRPQLDIWESYWRRCS